MASNLSFGTGCCPSLLGLTTCPRGLPFGPGVRLYPASYPRQPLEGAVCCLGFLSPFGRRRWLVGHPVPPRGWPSLRSAYRTLIASGPRRGFHAPHERDTAGVGCPLYSGTAVLTQSAGCLRLPPTALQRLVLNPGVAFHLPGLNMTSIIGGLLAFTRLAFPLPVIPGWSGNPWAFLLKLRTSLLLVTPVEVGTDLSTDPGLRCRCHIDPPIRESARLERPHVAPPPRCHE